MSSSHGLQLKSTIWESKSTKCFELQCQNESGPIYWNQCNKTNEVCETDQCVVKKEEDMFTVVIEVIEGIDLVGLNMTEIQSTISNLTNIEPDKIRIRVNTNDNNEVVQIVVVPDDKILADNISQSVNVAIEEQNQKDVIRLFKNARVVVEENVLSISSRMKTKDEMIFMVTMTFIIVVILNQLLQGRKEEKKKRKREKEDA